MHKHIQIHSFLSPQPSCVIQEGLGGAEGGWTWGKATLMKSLY